MARERDRLADCADCGDCADCLARVAGAAGISTGADAAVSDAIRDADYPAIANARVYAYTDGTTEWQHADGRTFRHGDRHKRTGDRKPDRPTPPDTDPTADFDAYAARMARRHGWGYFTWHWARVVSRDVPA